MKLQDAPDEILDREIADYLAVYEKTDDPSIRSQYLHRLNKLIVEKKARGHQISARLAELHRSLAVDHQRIQQQQAVQSRQAPSVQGESLRRTPYLMTSAIIEIVWSAVMFLLLLLLGIVLIAGKVEGTGLVILVVGIAYHFISCCAGLIAAIGLIRLDAQAFGTGMLAGVMTSISILVNTIMTVGADNAPLLGDAEFAIGWVLATILRVGGNINWYCALGHFKKLQQAADRRRRDGRGGSRTTPLRPGQMFPDQINSGR